MGDQEDKEGVSAHTFQCDHFGGGVHDCRVSSDGSPDGIARVSKVDDDDLGGVPHFLPNADKLVGLHGEGSKPNLLDVNPNILELKKKGEKMMKKMVAKLSQQQPIKCHIDRKCLSTANPRHYRVGIN